MKWYIGQLIVAISNQPEGYFVKGQEFKVCGLSVQCECGTVVIDIGVKISPMYRRTVCSCGKTRNVAPIGFSETRFAPLDVDISELTELLTNQETLSK